ncbi:MAG: hypothetical protein IJB96_09560 [Lachnospira sp.]|nr:hypothetical protein [Lachnospira sp.]
MICPYCEQGEVVNARIRKNGKEIFVCQECDTVWYQVVNLTTGIGFDLAMSNEGCNNSWDELEFSTNINMESEIMRVITDYNSLSRGYVVRDGYVFTSLSAQTNVFDAIVIINSAEVGSWGNRYGEPQRSLDEHIEYINKFKLKKAKIIADTIDFLGACPTLMELQIIPTIKRDNFNFSYLYGRKNVKVLSCITNYGDSGEFKSEVDYSRIGGIEELAISGTGHKNYCCIQTLKDLWISNNKDYDDLESIGNSTNLQSLTIMQCGVKSVNGIGRIRELKNMYLSYNRCLTDIAEICTQGGNLKTLTIEACPKITDFSCLYSLTQLEHLVLNGSNDLPDLKFLSVMPNLKTFSFTMNVEDGDLSICKRIPYVHCGKGREHYNLKDKDLPKNIG